MKAKKHRLDIYHYLKIYTTANSQDVEVYKEGDKMPYCGTSFSLSYSLEDIKKWANDKIYSSIEAKKEKLSELLEQMDGIDVFEVMRKAMQSQYITEQCIEHLNNEGYVVVKAETQKEAEQLTQAVCGVIPHYNRQQVSIFTC